MKGIEHKTHSFDKNSVKMMKGTKKGKGKGKGGLSSPPSHSVPSTHEISAVKEQILEKNRLRKEREQRVEARKVHIYNKRLLPSLCVAQK